MSKLGDFLIETVKGNSAPGGVPALGEMRSGIGAALVAVPAKTAPAAIQQFENELTQLATSTEFLSAVGDEVGDPRVGESEDAYVARAKQAMRGTLQKMLG
jgi:hypothetical protein